MKRRDFIKSPDNEVASSASGVTDSLNSCFPITLREIVFDTEIVPFLWKRSSSKSLSISFDVCFAVEITGIFHKDREFNIYDHFTEFRYQLESANSQIIISLSFNR